LVRHGRTGPTTPSFALWRSTAAASCENTVPVRAECDLTTEIVALWYSQCMSLPYRLLIVTVTTRERLCFTSVCVSVCLQIIQEIINRFWRHSAQSFLCLNSIRKNEFSLWEWPPYPVVPICSRRNVFLHDGNTVVLFARWQHYNVVNTFWWMFVLSECFLLNYIFSKLRIYLRFNEHDTTALAVWSKVENSPL